MSNELGIDQIKIVVDELFDTSTKIYGALRDGFQFMEDSWVIFQEAKDIPVIIASGKAAYAQILDLSAEEHQELADWAQDRWDVPNTEIDDRIEEALQLTAETHLYAENGISLVGKWKDWGQKFSTEEE